MASCRRSQSFLNHRWVDASDEHHFVPGGLAFDDLDRPAGQFSVSASRRTRASLAAASTGGR